MGSSVLKLLPITRNFWLLLPSPSSEWLLPSPAMAMVMVTDMDMVMDMVMDMAMDTATMARGRLRLPPMLSLAMDMATEAMDTATMARGPLMLRLPLLPSPAMDMVTDTAMVMVTAMDMAMEAMAMDTTATTAKGLLM